MPNLLIGGGKLMGYMALYRKYRPRSLPEVVGQKAVVRTLVNALKGGQIHHAYLLCGPRGTGKTSVARAFARSVNCHEGPTPEPCGKCVSCLRIEQGSSTDMVEIDAASNRGIDEIRALKGTVSFSPSEGKFKIYIIDEVHMLTKGAFNAFLKTLEDPPPGVLFLLATTEPHQVLPTIISRCQRFDFTLHTQKDIVERLSFICKEEGIEADAEALETIAIFAEGGLRDAISILDQAISFTGGKIKEEDVIELLGRVDQDTLQSMVEAVCQSDISGFLELIHFAGEKGKDPRQLADDLSRYLRQVLIIKECGYDTSMVELTAEKRKAVYEDGKDIARETLLKMLEVLAELNRDLKFSTQPHLLLEIAGVRLAVTAEDNLAHRLKTLEKKVEQLDKIQVQGKIKEEMKKPQKKKEEKETEKIEESTEKISELQSKWPEFMNYLQEKKERRLCAFLEPAAPLEIKDNTIIIEVRHSFHHKNLEKNKDMVQRRVKEFFQLDLKPVFSLRKEEGEEEDDNNDDEVLQDGEKKKEKSLREHPVVKGAIELLDARIIDG